MIKQKEFFRHENISQFLDKKVNRIEIKMHNFRKNRDIHTYFSRIFIYSTIFK